jgi:flavodoxin
MKALVAYYSRTGTTDKLAKDLAARLGCDIDPIVSTGKWEGVTRWMACGKAGMKKELTELEPPKLDPAQYDLVIVGTPIWAGFISAPTRTYLHENKGKLKRVAFFLTCGGEEYEKGFDDMETVAGQKPVAKLAVRARDMKAGKYSERAGAFVAELGK